MAKRRPRGMSRASSVSSSTGNDRLAYNNWFVTRIMYSMYFAARDSDKLFIFVNFLRVYTRSPYYCHANSNIRIGWWIVLSSFFTSFFIRVKLISQLLKKLTFYNSFDCLLFVHSEISRLFDYTLLVKKLLTVKILRMFDSDR